MKKDSYFPFKIARRRHGDLQKSTLVGIDNAAHFCQKEASEKISREIEKFLLPDPV